MTQEIFGKAYGGPAADNYERYFVPAVGAPLAADLVAAAALRPGERVLDVACGTGVVTRLAARAVGETGSVAGLDVNPHMLEVARRSTPAELGVRWYETSAVSTPLPDSAFDVVLCQMGLQFFPGKLEALQEMRRVLAPGGRALVNVPGPTPRLFAAMADALARHIAPEAASFVHVVFGLHDEAQLRELMTKAGFRSVEAHATTKALPLPPAQEFLWQYISSTPLFAMVLRAPDKHRVALEADVCARWRELCGDALVLDVRLTNVIGRT